MIPLVLGQLKFGGIKITTMAFKILRSAIALLSPAEKDVRAGTKC
jgi:hypothetical protein